MKELIKIRDMSVKYDISARTLRYYEDIGLIKSTRSNDYAYRLYDEATVQRLEQILILRKLNIKYKGYTAYTKYIRVRGCFRGAVQEGWRY